MFRKFSIVSLLVGLALAAACSSNPKPDTSQLSPTGQQTLTRLHVVQVVNDVTTAAITANKAGQLTDAATVQVLTVNKQVLDVVQANPIGFKAQALAIIANARQALPPPLADLVNNYLARVFNVLQEVK